MKNHISFTSVFKHSLLAAFLLVSGLLILPQNAQAASIKKYNGHYYAVFEKSMTWSDAKAFCEKRNGHLVTITSSGEQEFIESLSLTRTAYWLGATDEITEGTWEWITGETWSYTNWSDGEPTQYNLENGSEEDYSAINFNSSYEGYWYDECNVGGDEEGYTLAEHGLICEWDSASDLPQLSACTITLSKTKYKYTGSAKKPTVTIKYGTVTLTKGTDYTVSYKNNKSIGTASVTIKGKGYFKGTVKKTFKIVPVSTKISSLTATTSGLKIKWKKVSGVSGYEIQYSTSKSFSSSKSKTISGASKTAKTVKNLKSGKTWYVRIRTYKKVSGKTYYSSWSSAKKIKYTAY